MPNFYTPDSGYTGTATLASAVANTGTVTVAYPTGATQKLFLNGLSTATTEGYVVINKNDRWNASASKVSFTFNSSDITITNSSGTSWAAGSTIDYYLPQIDGNDSVLVTIPVFAMAGISAADVVTSLPLGMSGTIESVHWLQGVPVTTAAKLATITPYIDGVAVTGGVLSLTSAACTPLGKIVAGSAVTAANTLAKGSVLSFTASAVTAFAEGSGSIVVRIRKS